MRPFPAIPLRRRFLVLASLALVLVLGGALAAARSTLGQRRDARQARLAGLYERHDGRILNLEDVTRALGAPDRTLLQDGVVCWLYCSGLQIHYFCHDPELGVLLELGSFDSARALPMPGADLLPGCALAFAGSQLELDAMRARAGD